MKDWNRISVDIGVTILVEIGLQQKSLRLAVVKIDFAGGEKE
jgi:hypothetical protein